MERFHTTITERGSFRDCRRRWFYEVIQRLAPRTSVPWNLIFGECVHEAMSAYYGGRRSLKQAQDAFLGAWEKENEELKDTLGGFYDMGVGDEWVDFRVKGLEMLKWYHTYDRANPFFKKIIEVNVEERAFVDILDNDEEQIPGLPLLSGRIDLVVERDDGIWIWDHKTAMSTPSLRALDVDDQLTGYCYIWWRLTGQVARGAIYNVLVKEPPHPPKLLKGGRLSTDKSQRTCLEFYLQAIKEHGLDKKDYLEMLEFLDRDGRWKQFFVRDGSQRNEAELLSFEERLYTEYKHMCVAIDDHYERYPNMSQWNCGNCSVISICQAIEEREEPTWIIENGYREQPSRVQIPDAILSDKWKGVPVAAS